VQLRVNERNLGHFKTRNQHLPSARGDYVAMLDSDDYAFPHRLARQVAFLDAHADHALVGSWAARMDARGRTRGILTRPLSADDIRAQQLFVGCFKHSTVMARRSVLLAHPYPEESPVSQDVVLWTRLAEHYPLANLPEILIRYRWHAGGISKRRRELVREVKLKVARGLLDALEVEHTPQDLARHYDLRSLRGKRIDRDFVAWAADWLERLMAANVRLRRYPEPAFSRALGGRWLAVSAAALVAGVSPRGAARGGPLPRLARASLRRDAALYARRAPRLAAALLSARA
jgi:glycosyltransferase involved in cell wall biosynthesis